MPFIKAAIKDAREPELVPEAKYDLEILSHKCLDGEGNTVSAEDDPTRIQCVIRIDSDDHPNAELVFHTLWLKSAKEEYVASTLRDMRRFLAAFEVPFEENGFNPDDLDEAKASVITVYQKEGNDVVMRHSLRLPRYNEESQEPPRRGSGRKSEPEKASAGSRRSRR